MANSNGYTTLSNGVGFDLENGRLIVKEKVRFLQSKEIELLRYFLTHPNIIVARTDLLKNVWSYDESVDTRTVDVHVSNLRKKINGGIRNGIIRTVHGVGYAYVTA